VSDETQAAVDLLEGLLQALVASAKAWLAAETKVPGRAADPLAKRMPEEPPTEGTAPR
jgi:hypothetical protein